MTQLVSSKESYCLSTEYHKLAFSISQFESRTETCPTPRTPSFVPLPIELPRRSRAEISVFLPKENIELLEGFYSFGDPLMTTALNIISKEIELLEVFYPFANPNEVRDFLWANKYLIKVLFEAHKQIKRVFGGNIVEVCLEWDRDPEEDFEGLFVIVKTSLSPEESLDLLDRFDEEWFLDNVSGEIGSMFTVTVRPT